MKKLKIAVTLLLAACLFSGTFCTALADSRPDMVKLGLVSAQSLVDPNGTSRDEKEAQRIKENYERLVRAAYNTDEYMVVPELEDMPKEGKVKYVMGKHGMGTDFYDEPKGEAIGVIEEGAKVTAYVYSGEYVFVEVEDGPVCWCKSKYLYKSYSLEWSSINKWNYLGSLGIG